MPMAAISSAEPPKIVSSNISKRCREVLRTTISSMLRTWATAKPPLASRSTAEIGLTKV
jgi:hypothetical protein